MALDILHDNWGPYTHTEVENALKAYLTVLENRINQAIQSGGVGMADLSAEVQTLLNMANTALQPENIAAWAKAQNKPGYTADEITGITGFQNLLAKLQDMDAKIQAAAESGGVDPDDEMSSTSEKPVQNKVIKAYVDAAVLTLQNALNALMNGQSVTDAIDTFNEIKAFLYGIDTDDPTLYNQLLALNNAITALQTTLSQKANDNAVVKSISVNGTAQTKDGNGNVNVSVPTLTLDDAPTAGSNNAVKSGGIKTAIDQATPTIDANGKWVIGGVTTDKDAQGPRGNTVLVNENAVGIQALIVNNVVDGGETDILSAEMGKVIRQNIMRIFNALGTYAFPEGKPILNWGSTVINHSINVNGVTGGVTIADVEIDGVSAASLPAQIVEGKSLSLRLALPSNLYVFDDGVSVKMGGVDITSTAFSEATGEINIAAVTDDVVIMANGLTYVDVDGSDNKLAFNLDCKNVGSNSGFWTDLIGGNKFKLTDVTINDSGAVFNGSSSKAVVMDATDPTQVAIGTKNINVDYKDGTLEIIATTDALPTSSNGRTMPLLINPKEKGIMSHFSIGSTGTYNGKLIMCFGMTVGGTTNGHYSLFYNAGTDIEIAVNTNEFSGDLVRFGGVTQSATWYDTWIGGNTQSAFSVGYRYRNNNGTITEQYFKGTIKAIRVYKTKLTEQDMIQNYKVDKKRFNLA